MTDPDAIESRKRVLRGRLVSEAVWAGREAAIEGLPEDCCPYGEGSDIGLRCAWLAGFRDHKRFGE